MSAHDIRCLARTSLSLKLADNPPDVLATSGARTNKNNYEGWVAQPRSSFICMYIYIYIYIYAYIYIYIYIYIVCVYVYVYIYIYTHTWNIYVWLHIFHVAFATELLRVSECWYDSLITCTRTHHQVPRGDSQVSQRRARSGRAVGFPVASFHDAVMRGLRTL